MESYQISAYLLDMLNIHEGTMTKFHQTYMNDPVNEQQYLEEMEVLEYDILYGDQEIYGGDNPYEATDLQMGVVPIQMDQVVYSEPNLLIYGENFNTYSKVCINGKTMETQYIWPQLLLVRDVPEKKALDPATEITVQQVEKIRYLWEKPKTGGIIFGNKQRQYAGDRNKGAVQPANSMVERHPHFRL